MQIKYKQKTQTNPAPICNILILLKYSVFMAEEGIECLTKRKEAILSCVNKTVPELFKTVHNKLQSTYPGAMRRSVDPVIVFNQENCR